MKLNSHSIFSDRDSSCNSINWQICSDHDRNLPRVYCKEATATVIGSVVREKSSLFLRHFVLLQ